MKKCLAFLVFALALSSCGSGSVESPLDDIDLWDARKEIIGTEENDGIEGFIEKCFGKETAASICSNAQNDYNKRFESSSSSVPSSSSARSSSSISSSARSSSSVSSSSRSSSSSARSSSSSARSISSSARSSSSRSSSSR